MAERPIGDTTLQGLLDRLAAGDPKALDALVEHSVERFRHMARKMLNSRPRLRRWEETDDILQGMAMRLQRALQKVKSESVRAFVGLAATMIRRQLIDLMRKHFGPEGDAGHHKTDPQFVDSKGRVRSPVKEAKDPRANILDGLQRQEEWQKLHEHVERLAEAEREVLQLLYYQDLTQAEVARLLGVSESTVKRRHRDARLSLHRVIHGEPPSP
jgi:RNA polymerase sigma-70 factor (ECF subfamily)